MALPKRYVAIISDPQGNALGPWLDIPSLPALHLGLGGTNSITLTLRRPYGRLDEPGEPGGWSTLQWKNRFDLYVASTALSARGLNSPAVGYAVVGLSGVGEPVQGPGQLVWAGTIEDVTPRPPDAVDVAIVSVDHQLDEAVVPGTYALGGDPLTVARDVVTRYCRTLTWDAGNPLVSGSTVASSYQNQTVRSILQSLANQAGTNYLLTVSPLRTVRLIQPDTSTAMHTLVFGVHFIDPQLGKLGNNRVQHVVLVYAGGYVEAFAPGWTPTDGREAVYTDTSVTEPTLAQGLANNLLAGRNLITLRAQVTVLDEAYPIDTIQVGDTVNLLVPSALTGLSLGLFSDTGPGVYDTAVYDTATFGPAIAAGEGGSMDYARFALIVTGIDYELTRAVLTLSEAVPTTEIAILKLSQQLAAHLAGG